MTANLPAIEFMSTRVISVTPDISIVTAAKIMNKNRIGGLPVCRGKKLVGIITERDIMQNVIAKDKQPAKVKVRSIMISPPKVIGHVTDDLSTLGKMMSEHDVSRIPIVDNEELIGIVTNKDIARQAPQLIDMLVEDAIVKGHRGSAMPSAFGKCNSCGTSSHLTFSEETSRFLCSDCYDPRRSEDKVE